MKNFIKEIETLKKNQMEISDLKQCITEMKNELNGGLDKAAELVK